MIYFIKNQLESKFFSNNQSWAKISVIQRLNALKNKYKSEYNVILTLSQANATTPIQI